jgi:hypothetical protein
MADNCFVIISPARNEEFCEWLYQHGGVGSRINANEARCIAYVQVADGVEEVLTVCALSRWTLGSCEASLASNGTKQAKASRQYIWTIFDFAFNHAGKTRMHTFVATDNHKSIAVQNMLGLKQEAVLKDHFGEGKDALLFGITKADWQKGKWASPEASTHE